MTTPLVTISGPSVPVVTITAPTETPSFTLTAFQAGPPGPPGVDGVTTASYIHTQASVSYIWTVAHNLGFRPNVSVTTTGGVEVEGGEVLHISSNVLTITFDVAFTGAARCT